MTKNERWETFKLTCEELNKGFDSRILDYIAVIDILECHARGLSLNKIKDILEEEEWYIIEVVEELLGDKPYQEPLEFNPYFFYCIYYNDRDKYVEEVYEATDHKYTKKYIRDRFKVMEKFDRIRKKVEDYYAKN